MKRKRSKASAPAQAANPKIIRVRDLKNGGDERHVSQAAFARLFQRAVCEDYPDVTLATINDQIDRLADGREWTNVFGKMLESYVQRGRPGETPNCPNCRSRKTFVNGDAGYYCADCKALFDDQPDEGGDYFRDPARRMEAQEERRERRRARR